MKKIFLLLSIISLMISCDNQDSYNSAFREYVGIRTTGVTTTLPEDGGGTFTIPVYYGGKNENGGAIVVNYEVSGGVYGTDYTIVGGSSATGTVTVPAGTTGGTAFVNVQIKPKADFVTESNQVLRITLTSTDGKAQVGYPLKQYLDLTIQDDDCDYVFANLKGTAKSKEKYSDGSVYPSGTGTYNTVFTEVSANHVSMDNFWDSGMVIELTYDGPTRVVTVVDRSWSQYGYSWNITGSGTLSTCGKSLKVNFHLTSPDYDGGYDDTFEISYQFP